MSDIESFTRAVILNHPYGRPQLPQTVGNPDQEQAMGAEGYSEERQLNQQDPPTEIHIWNVILSFKESFDLFVQYLRYRFNVFVRRRDLGSLLITVECSSLQSLEGLWEDYCSGHLNEIAQEMLVTADVLEKLGLTDVKLKTFISEEEYEKGKQIFMDNSGELIIIIIIKRGGIGDSSKQVSWSCEEFSFEYELKLVISVFWGVSLDCSKKYFCGFKFKKQHILWSLIRGIYF